MMFFFRLIAAPYAPAHLWPWRPCCLRSFQALLTCSICSYMLSDGFHLIATLHAIKLHFLCSPNLLSQLSTRTLLFNQCIWHTPSLLLWLCDTFDLFEKSENPLKRTSIGSKGNHWARHSHPKANSLNLRSPMTHFLN